MATIEAADKSSASFFIKSADIFKTEVKNRLIWSKQQWRQSGEVGNKMNKLCNSLKYWKDKLNEACEDVSIIFTLYNVSNDIRIDLLSIVSEIEKINDKIKVQGYTEFRNPRYLGIYFSSKEERDYVANNFKMIGDHYVVYLTWALEPSLNERDLNVYWLPWTMKIETIEEKLKEYVECVESHRINTTFMSGRVMQSGKVAFKVRVNDGVSVESIPHVLKVANLEALITIPGRLPLCLNCNELGHISKKCVLRYCVKCFALCKKEHVCIANKSAKSYASAVKSAQRDDVEIDADDWQAVVYSKETSIVDGNIAKEGSVYAETIAKVQESIEILEQKMYEGKRLIENKEKVEVQGCTVDSVQLSSSEVSSDSMSEGDAQDDNTEFTEILNVIKKERKEKLSSVAESSKTLNSEKSRRKSLGKKRSKKRKFVDKDGKVIISNEVSDLIVEKNKEGNSIKTYSKAKSIISKRKQQELKQELKFKKSLNEQEFVFTD